VDERGRFVTAYPGQLQAAEDLRGSYPIPDRASSTWARIDPDEQRYFPWVLQKLAYNPFNAFIAAGYLADPDHRRCRTAAFSPGSPCFAYHSYNVSPNREGYDAYGYGRYRVFHGLGIGAAKVMGGRFIQRLAERGLDARLKSLYVLHGTTGGSAPDAVFETDGMSCPTCPVRGDGVLFEKSIAAVPQLTQGWSSAKRAADAKQEGVPFGHLEVGVTPAVWTKILAHLAARD
ncbi:MAG: alpha/beta hydrolase, partial [Myxococcales bacterium]